MKFGKDGEDEFLDEIREIVLEDRDKLRQYYDKFLRAVSEEELKILGAAEMVSKLSDSLVKTNSQLIELAKVRTKKSKSGSPAYGSPEDRENMLDEIQEGRELFSVEEDIS
jgi:hypothetical protein